MPTITQYKTGIDLILSGTEGTDYAIERPCHDVYLGDRQVIYIKDSTDISFAHNARNVARPSGSVYVAIGADGQDATPDSGDEGIIRYKVDRDLHWGPLWYALSELDAALLPAYSAPFSFADLEYTTGVPVVGTTGPNSGSLPTNATKTSFYWRGIVDSVGDEWHTITVADDDRFCSTDSEWKASDGKVFLFVVNPITPCLSIAATGDGQFHTTAPKRYFVPVIYDQSTYFNAGTGTVTFTLRDINGGNISYKINGGSAVNVGASSVALDQDDFSTGSNTLEYWITATPAVVKTRTVVKNPTHPSAGETHGNIAWGGAGQWAAIEERLAREPYASKLADWKTNRTGHSAWDSSGVTTGQRYVTTLTGENALYAKIYGVSAKRDPGDSKTYAQYAKEMLMHNMGTIDSVGWEMGQAQVTIPTRETRYRGYWDADQPNGSALAYDILIDIFKDSDAAGGITAIEDYIIRDSLARYVNEEVFGMNNLDPTNSATPRAGMWDTCRRIGALFCALVMPSYQSEIFGVSGFDGSSATGEWNPFPNTAATWADLLANDTVSPTVFPDLQTRGLGVETYNFNEDGNFVDRLVYFGDELMGRNIAVAVNLLYRNTAVTLPMFELGFLNSVNGDILGIQDASGPEFHPLLACQNEYNRTTAIIGNTEVQALDPSNLRSETNSITYTAPWSLLWYNDDTASSPNPMADSLILNQVSNTDPVTELWRRGAALDSAASDYIVQHSGDYPTQPDDFRYDPVRGNGDHVMVLAGTVSLATAQAKRNAVDPL